MSRIQFLSLSAIYIILGFIVGVSLQFALFKTIVESEFVEIYAPLLMSMFQLGALFYLNEQVRQAEKDRSQIKMENDKARRVTYLRDKLDFYSLLIAHRGLFVEGDYENTKVMDIDPFMTKYLIKGKYEFLSLQKLKLNLREYFQLSPSEIRADRDNWKRLMKTIRDCIDVDFHYLSQEYDDLTKRMRSA